MKRVCIIGCGSIGSLYAAHLARVTETWAYVRRAEHARALNEHGISVTGSHEFHAKLRAANDPAEMPRSEEHTSELQSQSNLVCRLLLEKKKKKKYNQH